MEYFNKKVEYKVLNGKQKEIYNFQKVSAVLAEYGYTTIKLDDDWIGADFIAIHFDGKRYLKVQLKGRLTFDKKYVSKDIFICFCDKVWMIYPHDELLKIFEPEFQHSVSWKEKGMYSFSYLTNKSLKRLEEFVI